MLDFIGGRHRIASVKRQMNALPISLGNAAVHGDKEDRQGDQVLAAMAGGGCVDEHDAVFRAEQGWQVMLLEAGIIFHSYVRIPHICALRLVQTNS
jgi:hypothetical protein